MPPREYEWTFMVLFAADNNLTPYADANLEMMSRVGSSEDVALVALVDRPGSDPRPGTRVYYFGAAGTPLDENETSHMESVNTGDPSVISTFVAAAAARRPARHYCLVLWGHGGGTDEMELDRPTSPRPSAPSVPSWEEDLSLLDAAARRERRHTLRDLFGFEHLSINDDFTSHDLIDNTELAQALRDAAKAIGRPLDVLGMDACLMSMVEIAGQVGGTASILVASQQTIPNASWPYETILGALLRAPATSGADLARLVVDAYADAFIPQSEEFSVTLSALDLEHYGALEKAVGDLCARLISRIDDDFVENAVRTCRRRVQAFDDPSFADLYHYAYLLANHFDAALALTGGDGASSAPARETEALRDACVAVKDCIAQGFVIHHRHAGASVANSHGVSIAFPTMPRGYSRLAFARKTHWDSLLGRLFGTSLGAEAVRAASASPMGSDPAAPAAPPASAAAVAAPAPRSALRTQPTSEKGDSMAEKDFSTYTARLDKTTNTLYVEVPDDVLVTAIVLAAPDHKDAKHTRVEPLKRSVSVSAAVDSETYKAMARASLASPAASANGGGEVGNGLLSIGFGGADGVILQPYYAPKKS